MDTKGVTTLPSLSFVPKSCSTYTEQLSIGLLHVSIFLPSYFIFHMIPPLDLYKPQFLFPGFFFF